MHTYSSGFDLAKDPMFVFALLGSPLSLFIHNNTEVSVWGFRVTFGIENCEYLDLSTLEQKYCLSNYANVS